MTSANISQHRPFTMVRDQYLASLSGAPIMDTAELISPKEQDAFTTKSIDTHHVRSSSRGRSVSPLPKAQLEVAEKSAPKRRFSKSPIRGEMVGKLSASYEPNIVHPSTTNSNSKYNKSTEINADLRSTFQSSLSAYACAASISSSTLSSKIGHVQNKSNSSGTQIQPTTSLGVMREPIPSPKLTPKNPTSVDPSSNLIDVSSSNIHAVGVKDESLESSIPVEANVTPSSIRARNNLSAAVNVKPSSPTRNFKSTRKGNSSIISTATCPWVSARKSIEGASSFKGTDRREDEGTNVSHSSQLASSSLTSSTVQIEKVAFTTKAMDSPLSNDALHFTFPKSSPDHNDVIKRDSTPKSNNFTTPPLTPNHFSKGSTTYPTASDVQYHVEVQALRKHMEDKMKSEIRLLEDRLERQYNQRFEQMEAKMNERLQQIRSSLQEFLIVAENEGIYLSSLDTRVNTTTVYKK